MDIGEEPIREEDDDLLCVELLKPDPLPEEGRMDLVAEPSGTFQLVDAEGNRLGESLTLDLASPEGPLQELMDPEAESIQVFVEVRDSNEDGKIGWRYVSPGNCSIWTDEFHVACIDVRMEGAFQPGSIDYVDAVLDSGGDYYVAGRLSADAPLNVIFPVPPEIWDEEFATDPSACLKYRKDEDGAPLLEGLTVNEAFLTELRSFYCALFPILCETCWPTVEAFAQELATQMGGGYSAEDLMAGKVFMTPSLQDPGEYQVYIVPTGGATRSPGSSVAGGGKTKHVARVEMEVWHPGTVNVPGGQLDEKEEDDGETLALMVNEDDDHDDDDAIRDCDHPIPLDPDADNDTVKVNLLSPGVEKGEMVLSVSPYTRLRAAVEGFQEVALNPSVTWDLSEPPEWPLNKLLSQPLWFSFDARPLPPPPSTPQKHVEIKLAYKIGDTIVNEERVVLSTYRFRFGAFENCGEYPEDVCGENSAVPIDPRCVGFDYTTWDAWDYSGDPATEYRPNPPWLVVPVNEEITRYMCVEPVALAEHLVVETESGSAPETLQVGLDQGKPLLTVLATQTGEATITAKLWSEDNPILQSVRVPVTDTPYPADEAKLTLDVKPKKEVPLAFFYVKGNPCHNSSLSEGAEVQFVKWMNEVWGPQANVSFESRLETDLEITECLDYCTPTPMPTSTATPTGRTATPTPTGQTATPTPTPTPTPTKDYVGGDEAWEILHQEWIVIRENENLPDDTVPIFMVDDCGIPTLGQNTPLGVYWSRYQMVLCGEEKLEEPKCSVECIGSTLAHELGHHLIQYPSFYKRDDEDPHYNGNHNDRRETLMYPYSSGWIIEHREADVAHP